MCCCMHSAPSYAMYDAEAKFGPCRDVCTKSSCRQAFQMTCDLMVAQALLGFGFSCSKALLSHLGGSIQRLARISNLSLWPCLGAPRWSEVFCVSSCTVQPLLVLVDLIDKYLNYV
jgi:hypothetical protein